MAKDLTQLTLSYLKPSGSRRETPDGHTRGLYYVLQPSGKASWALRYRLKGRSCKLTLGPYPALDLPAARRKAADALARIADGDDPAAEKQAAKAAERIPSGHDIVETVAAEFVARYAKPKQKSWRETARMLEREVVAPRTIG